MVTGYDWLPEFWYQGGYRLQLVTRILVSGGYRLPLVIRILVSGWLPVTTGYHNFGLKSVTGYQRLPKNQNFSGNQVTG